MSRGQEKYPTCIYIPWEVGILKPVVRRAMHWTLLGAVCLILGIMLFMWPEGSSEGVRNGLSLCASVVIPSLFPFMVLSAFLIKSGLAERMGRVLEPVTRFIFGLPGCTAAPILMSLIGGFPVGARAAAELRRRGEISQRDFTHMLCFCINAGPAFMVGAVGSMIGSYNGGLLLYLAQIGASLLLGIVMRFVLPRKQGENAPTRFGKTMGTADAFVESVADTAVSMLSICAFVVIFAALTGMFQQVGVTRLVSRMMEGPIEVLGLHPALAGAVFPCILEITTGCAAAANAGTAAIPLIGAAAGWSGLSVQCQVLSTMRDLKPSKKWFWIGRVSCAALSGILATVLMQVWPRTQEVFSTGAQPVPQLFSFSAPASVALLVFAAFMVLVARPSRVES